MSSAPPTLFWLAAAEHSLRQARAADRFPQAILVHAAAGAGGEELATFAAQTALCREPGAPCIDDARIPQHCKQLGRPCERREEGRPCWDPSRPLEPYFAAAAWHRLQKLRRRRKRQAGPDERYEEQRKGEASHQA